MERPFICSAIAIALLALTAGAGCGCRCHDLSFADARPVPVLDGRRHSNPEGAIRACLAARQASTEADPGEGAATVAAACADVYVERECREAMGDFNGAPVEARAATLAMACREAYCPILPAPRPRLCGLDWDSLVPTELLGLWSELNRAILVFDLGEELAGELAPSGSAGQTGAGTSDVAAEGEPPAATVSTLHLAIDGSELRANLAPAAGASASRPVPADGPGWDLSKILSEMNDLPRDQPVAITAEPAVTVTAVLAARTALRTAGFEDVRLGLDPSGGDDSSDCGPAGE